MKGRKLGENLRGENLCGDECGGGQDRADERNGSCAQEGKPGREGEFEVAVGKGVSREDEQEADRRERKGEADGEGENEDKAQCGFVEGDRAEQHDKGAGAGKKPPGNAEGDKGRGSDFGGHGVGVAARVGRRVRVQGRRIPRGEGEAAGELVEPEAKNEKAREEGEPGIERFGKVRTGEKDG